MAARQPARPRLVTEKYLLIGLTRPYQHLKRDRDKVSDFDALSALNNEFHGYEVNLSARKKRGLEIGAADSC